MINKRSFKIAGLLVIALLLATSAYALAESAGKMTSIEGKVDITKPGKAAVPAKLGDLVYVGDIIRTKLKSKCEVTFTDGNVLRLAENTRVRVSEYAMGKDGTLDLFRGKIQSIVGATGVVKGSKYEVHTPTAIAGVRGTNFFTYYQAGVTGVIFKEGQGYGYSLNRPEEVVTIKPGQAMIVVDPSQPPILRPATPQEIDKHTQDTAPSEKGKEEEARKEEKKEEAPAVKKEEAKEEGTKEETHAAAEPEVAPEPSPAPAPETPVAETKATAAAPEAPPPPPQPLVPAKQDTTPPEITISTQAEPASGYRLSNVDVSLSSNEDNTTYYYRIDGSDWTETPANFTLTDMTEGDHTLEVKGKDAAGNTSSPETRSFHLTRYNLYGEFFMSGNNVHSDATGKVAGVSRGNWGGWHVKMEGYGYSPHPSWQIQAGGQSYETTATNDGGYWIDTIDGTTDYDNQTLTGTSYFSYLSKDRVGYGEGKTQGSYSGNGTYHYVLEDSGKGKYTEIPLAFSGLIEGAYHYFDDESQVVTYDEQDVNGVIGSTESPFDSATETNVPGEDVTLYVMGKADDYREKTWWGGLSGSYAGSSVNLPDGFIGGRTYEDFLEGILVSLYVDDSGKAGILEGGFEGSNYTEISMFKATSGSIKATLKGTGYTNQTNRNYIEGFYYGDFLPQAYDINDVGMGYLGSYTVRLMKDSEPAPWGIFNMELGGKFTKDPTDSWRLELGGNGWLGDEGSEYWVSRIEGGQWSYDETKGYRIAGEFSGGRYITEKSLGIIKGRLLGSYDYGDGYGDWAAIGLGTFERTHDLTEAPNFSSVLEDGTLTAVVSGDFHYGTYKKHYTPEGKPGEHRTLEYEFGYFKDGQGDTKKGYRFEGKDTLINNDEMWEDWDYFPSYTYVKWKYNAERFDEKGNTPDSLDLSTDPPTSNNFPGAQYYRVEESSFSTNSTQQVANLNGIMGGLGYLWTAGENKKTGDDVDIAIIGNYDKNVELPVMFGTVVQSKRDVDGSTNYTTPDGGAYYGWLGGAVDSQSTDNLEGKLYGFYIAPDGTAGYLKGSIAGKMYTGIKMWEADGTVHTEYMKNTTGIGPQDLLGNLTMGAIEAQMSFGSFADTGWIGKVAMGWGETRSIKGQDWGIFYLIHGIDSFYENPGNKTNYTVHTAGVGEFGDFRNESGSFAPDYGYWSAQVQGTVDPETGKMYGELKVNTGKFLTYTKAGEINDWQLIGTVTPDVDNSSKGSWQAISLGTWEAKQGLSFSSVIDGKTLLEPRERKKGYVSYDDGYSQFDYAYDVNRDKPEGYVVNRKYAADGMYERTWKDYHFTGANDDTPVIEVWTKEASKPEGEATYSYGGIYTKDNIDDKIYADMVNLTGKTAPTEEYQEHYLRDESGDFRGIMGGYGVSLWNATESNSTNLVFLGLYDNEEHREKIVFNGSLVSFDPRKTWDVNADSTSPIGGAYYGFFSGLIDEEAKDINGAVYALYVDDGNKGSTQKAGILKGSFSGSVYPRTVQAFEQGGIWDAEGSIYSIEMMKGTNIDPAIFNSRDRIYTEEKYYSEHFIINHGEKYSSLAGFSTSVYAARLNVAFIKGYYDWGVFENVEAGTYEGAPAGKVEWASGVDRKGGSGKLETTTYQFSDTNWDADKKRITGTFTGSVTRWEEAQNFVMGGDIHGMFNPDKKTYEMAIIGGMVTVDRFMGMVETEPERLKSLNIPTQLVGSDNLTGSGNGITVNMQNVSFYAYSTGQAPRIWATKDVEGSYTQTPQVNSTVNLTGQTLEAQFTIQKWQDGKWGAKVMGQTQQGKNIGGYEVKFTGAAAGAYQEAAGTFSGTAAGVSVPKGSGNGQ